MKVVELKDTKEDALKSLDDLRKRIETGNIIAFAAVGIEADDCVSMWIGSSWPTTNLKIRGAVSALQYHLQAGELG